MSVHYLKPHTHLTEEGILVKCYHKSKNTLCSPAFWIGITVSYPFEHLLWEKVWPFKILNHWMGLL
jgi:hypothetical protein